MWRTRAPCIRRAERDRKRYYASTNSLWDVGKTLCASSAREEKERREMNGFPSRGRPTHSRVRSVTSSQSRLSKIVRSTVATRLFFTRNYCTANIGMVQNLLRCRIFCLKVITISIIQIFFILNNRPIHKANFLPWNCICCCGKSLNR